MCFVIIHDQLVGGLEQCLFFHILEIIIPIDFHIFQRGGSTTNQSTIVSINHSLRLSIQWWLSSRTGPGLVPGHDQPQIWETSNGVPTSKSYINMYTYIHIYIYIYTYNIHIDINNCMYIYIYSNLLALRIFQNNTFALRISQHAMQFDLEYSKINVCT